MWVQLVIFGRQTPNVYLMHDTQRYPPQPAHRYPTQLAPGYSVQPTHGYSVQPQPGYPPQPPPGYLPQPAHGYYAAAPTPAEPLKKDRHSTPLTLGIILLFLVGLLFAADWVAARVTVHLVEQAVSSGLGGFSAQGADVQVHGSPFLTQLIGGNLQHATITIATGEVRGLEVSDVVIEAYDVGLRNPRQVGLLDIEATVSYTALEQALGEQFGMPVRITPILDNTEGLVQATSQVYVLGLSIPISIYFTPVVQGANVMVDIQRASIGGVQTAIANLPLGLGNLLENMRVPLPLPAGITVESITPLPDGLRVTGSATDFRL